MIRVRCFLGGKLVPIEDSSVVTMDMEKLLCVLLRGDRKETVQYLATAKSVISMLRRELAPGPVKNLVEKK